MKLTHETDGLNSLLQEQECERAGEQMSTEEQESAEHETECAVRAKEKPR